MPNVMHFDLLPRTTEFTPLCLETLEQFRTIALHLRWVVVQNGSLAVPQRNAAPGGYQWSLALLVFNHDLKPLA